MKYSKRELKAFNVLALLLFGLGSFFVVFGAIEFVFQPTTSYTVVRPLSSAEPLSEASAPLLLEESVDVQQQAQSGGSTQEIVVVDGTNFKAVSNALLGVVFLVLSFGLNFFLLRVMRREGRDRLKKA